MFSIANGTGNPKAVLANSKIRSIYTVLANKIIRCNLTLFLRLYKSFWKGFESDQRQLTNAFACLGCRK